MQTWLLINGELVEGCGAPRPVIDPANGEAVAQVNDASTEQKDEAVAAAHGAFTGWAATPPAERAAMPCIRHIQIAHD